MRFSRYVFFSAFFLGMPFLSQSEDAAPAGEAAPDPYRTPNVLEKPAFDPIQTGIDAKKLQQIANSAGMMARNLQISNEAKGQLLAIALTISPEHKIARPTHESLKTGVIPRPIQFNQKVDWNDVSRGFVDATHFVYGETFQPDGFKLLAMLFDTCVTIWPNASDLAYSRTAFLKSHPAADWDSILGKAVSF